MILKLAKHPIEFESDGHTYKMGGLLLTGVTTILNVRAKGFLKWWTVKEMYNFLLDKQEQIKAATPEEYEALLLEGKLAHTIKSKEALVSGQIAHKWIEAYIKGRLRRQGRLGTGGAPVAPVAPVMPDDEKAAASIKAFLDWESKHKVEWLASELVLGSPKFQFAGTIDAVAMVDGVFTLVDFKTSNQISEECYLQTAAYWMLLDENMPEGAERPAQRLILRIPKDGKEFETQIVPTPLTFDCETFVCLRKVWRWNVNYETNVKVVKR